MTTQQQGVRPGAGQDGGGNGAGPSVTVVGTRRRMSGLLWLGVALIVAGALGGWGLYAAVGQRAPVVAVAQPVPYGQQISATDLRPASLPGDTGLSVVAWEQRGGLVGQWAAADLRAGQLATPGSVMGASLPGDGQSIVGVPVKSSQLPATPLTARDRVLIVAAGAGGQQVETVDPSAETGSSVEATVLRVGADGGSGQRVVDVLVPRSSAESVAQLAGSGQAVLVIVPRS